MRLLTEIALIVVAAGVIAACLARLPAVAATRWPRASHPTSPRPQQLVELEGLVSRSTASAMTVHARLRPLLVDVVSRRLAARGDALDRMTDRDGVALLGERLWDIVRPARPFPEDGSGPGITLPELEAMLVALERL
jgi:hypothetical protein